MWLNSDAVNYVRLLKLRLTDKAVLKAIAGFANDEGECWPCQAVLQRETGADPKTLINVLSRLIEDELLEDTGRRKGATGQVIVYRLPGFDPVEGQHRIARRHRFPDLPREADASTAKYNRGWRTPGMQDSQFSDQRLPIFPAKTPNFGGRKTPRKREDGRDPLASLAGAPAAPSPRAPVVGEGDHRAGNRAGPGADHRPATAHIPAQAGADGVQGARQGGRTGKPSEPVSGLPEGQEWVQAPSTVSRPADAPRKPASPEAMVAVWDEVMAGCPIPPVGRLNPRRRKLLAEVISHPLLEGRLSRWRCYCEDLRADAWCRGVLTSRGRPVLIDQVATDEWVEKIHATDMVAQAADHLDRFGIPPDLPPDRSPSPPVAREEIPLSPEIWAMARTLIQTNLVGGD